MRSLDVWQWTASPYAGYPGYRPPAGALGEYNGKFMCKQFVLRGASCAMPRSHARRTYRNFFPRTRAGSSAVSAWPRSSHDGHHPAIAPCRPLQSRREAVPCRRAPRLAHPKKELPCKYFYDEVGSALFEQITELEEYYPTRTELGIMERHAAEMAGLLGPRCLLIEYGSGSSLKTRRLLDRLREPAGYAPIDVSGEHLRRSARALGEEYPEIEVLPLCADFTRPLGLPACRKAAARRVVYFPGSTLGNFAPEAALALLRQTAVLCGRDGALLLGIDLQKDPRVIEAAYNDRRGVTAAFNRNILVRINRELGADFDIEQFAHRAFYNAAQGRIEMHLVSRRDQVVRVGGVPFFFAAGESIHTENSYKYSLPALADLAWAGGFAAERVWADEHQYFSVAYFALRHSGKDGVLPGRAGGRALLPTHEAIPVTL